MRLPATCLTAALALALGACATTPPPTEVTGSEVTADSHAAWALLDLDHDGALSVEELESQHAVALLQDLGTADGDGDGAISHTEFDAWWPRMTRTPASSTMQALNASAAVTGAERLD
jgi:hypothetical protein